MNKSCHSNLKCVLPSLFVLQAEEQISRLQREKNDLQSRMEEDQEDMNELMKKHKAAVAQVTHPAQRAIEKPWKCILSPSLIGAKTFPFR